MNDGTWTGPRCTICGGPVRTDNILSICRKTAECRRKRLEHWKRTSRGEEKTPPRPWHNKAPYLLAGTVRARLTVLEDARTSTTRVLCRCECGTVARKIARMLNNGNTKSCGCLRKGKRMTHGLSAHPLYGTWHGVIQRTTKPNARSYPDYGGRGITICDRWRDVRLFIDDIERLIGDRPDGWSLNRIKNDGNYEPGNVEWAPPDVQTRNRRKVAELERKLAELRRENAELRARNVVLESRLF